MRKWILTTWIIIAVAIVLAFLLPIPVISKSSENKVISFNRNVNNNYPLYYWTDGRVTFDNESNSRCYFNNNSNVFITSMSFPEDVYEGQPFIVEIQIQYSNLSNIALHMRCDIFWPHTFEPDGGFVAMNWTDYICLPGNNNQTIQFPCKAPPIVDKDTYWGIDEGNNQIDLSVVSRNSDNSFNRTNNVAAWSNINVYHYNLPNQIRTKVVSSLFITGFVVSVILLILSKRARIK